MCLNISQFTEFADRICTTCLGRFIGKYGSGYTNLMRGMAIRYCLQNDIHELDKNKIDDYSRNVTEIKNIDCYICENIFDEVPYYVDLCVNQLKEYEFETFVVGSKVDNCILERDTLFRERYGLTYAEDIKQALNREIGKLLHKKIDKETDFEYPDITIIVDTRYNHIELEIRSIYIYGVYRKFVRDIPQTRWLCKRCFGKGCIRCNHTGKMYSTSVEEIIAAPVMETTKGIDHSFHGMGREDIDVVMLGTGRPFVLEIKKPKVRTINLSDIEKRINDYGKDRVEVSQLRYSNKDEIIRLKNAKVDKEYIVYFRVEKNINNKKVKELEDIFPIVIEQQTPTRVMYRRANKKRLKKIKEFRINKINNNSITAYIRCEGGTYVKEFVHGDMNRTIPNLSSMLGMKCELDKLDVVGVIYGEEFKRDKEKNTRIKKKCS